MSKLSYDDKLNIYYKKKEGISSGRLSSKYHVRKCVIDYLVSLIDKHGIDILRKENNIFHTKIEKQEAIDRVLINGEARWAVALDIGLPSKGMLDNWIKVKLKGLSPVNYRLQSSKVQFKKIYFF